MLNKRKINHIILLLLVATFLLGAVQKPVQQDRSLYKLSEISRAYNIEANDIEKRYDTLELFLKKDQVGKSYEYIKNLILEMETISGHYFSIYVLKNLDANLDYQNELLIQEAEQARRLNLEKYNVLLKAIELLNSNPQYKIVVQDLYGDYYPFIENNLQDKIILNNEISPLIQEYYEVVYNDISIAYKGEEWDMQKLAEAQNNGLDIKIMDEIYLELLKERNKKTGGSYLALVNKRNAFAKSVGYENYGEYAFAQDYRKDFTIQDTLKVVDQINEDIVRLNKKVEKLIEEERKKVGEQTVEEDFKDLVKKALENTPFATIYESLLSRELLVYGDGENAYIGAFCTMISDYKTPVIYMNQEDKMIDFKTLLHEFGHYLDAYKAYENGTEGYGFLDDFNIDLELAETASQGLELLMLTEYDRLFGEYSKLAKLETISVMLSAIRDANLFFNFELAVYSDEDLTIQGINKHYRRAGEAAGIDFHYKDLDEAYNWDYIQHLYEAPLYYISYGLSALTAIDFLVGEGDTKEEKYALYQKILGTGQQKAYTEVVKENGLVDIFDEVALAKQIEKMEKYIDKISKN